MPTADDEVNDPDAADRIYASAVSLLLEKTRDKKAFPLVYKELVSYGFRRNLWGLKAGGILFAIIGLVASAFALRLNLNHLPLAGRSFDLVVSFQVIEHLEDPTRYVDAIADLLRADGLALVTTPNLLMSDGVNPYHVHEYEADELTLP